jgi:phage tail sheath protein FI
MVDQCERLRDRVALIDPPFSAAASATLGPGPVRAWRSRFDSGFGALYHPWLVVPDPLSRGSTRPVPPSGHVAGQHAAMDRRSGVHRAAADVPLAWAQGASFAIDPAVHGVLNTDGINVITARTGRTLRVMGARTMSSDPTWSFLPVRRLVSALRDALDAATQWAVFEPNDDATRRLMQDNIATFLDGLWRQGALAGTVAAEAYRVRCDAVNNDDTRRANGELHVDIGIAPSRPMEFIVLRVGRQANSFELTEDAAPRAAYVGGAF